MIMRRWHTYFYSAALRLQRKSAV